MRDRTFHRAAFRLAFTVWLLYAAMSTGTLSADPETRYQVAWNIACCGRIALAEPNRHTVENDGRHFSVFFPGQSIMFLPVAAAQVAAGKAGFDDRLAGLASRFALTTFVMPVFGALAVLGFTLVLRRLNISRGHALAAGALLAVGTPLWIYGSAASEETALAALAIWSFWALIDARGIAEAERAHATGDPGAGRRFVNRIGLCGVLLACGLIHRSTFVAVVMGAALLALPLLMRSVRLWRGEWMRLMLWSIATLAIIAIVPLYNFARFGDPLDTGYTTFWEPFGGVFATPLLEGLHGHLTSPGKSLFLYVPWLLLLPLSLLAGRVWRRMNILLPAILLIAAVHLLIYGRHTAWSGEFAWGVRFHASLMPLLLMPIAVWLDGWRWRLWQRAVIVMLAAVTIAVQIAGGLLNWGLEHYQHPEYYTGRWGLIPDEAAWTWEGSQLRMRFVNLVDKVRGEALLPGVERDDERFIVTAWNLFPTRAAVAIDQRSITVLLWALWLALMGMSLVAAWLTVAAYRSGAGAAGTDGGLNGGGAAPPAAHS